MSASNFLELELLDHALGTASWTMPVGVFIALFSANPLDDGSGAELTGSGYAREAIVFGAASGGSAANTGVIDFDVVTGTNWLAATHFGIFDALTTGNLLFHGALATPRTAEVGQQVRIPIGEIVITAD